MAKHKPPKSTRTADNAPQAPSDDPPRLRGLADGKVIYIDDSGADRCVTDDPVLLRELEAACAKYFSLPAVMDLGHPLELAVLSVGETSARCRFLGSLATVTVRFSGRWFGRFVPGHIVSVQPIKQWRYARNAYLSAKLLSSRLNPPVAKTGVARWVQGPAGGAKQRFG